MGLTLAAVLFFALWLSWTGLALLPGLLEARRRTDVRPLRVVRASDVDIRHFARGLRARVDTLVGEALASCRACRVAVEGALEDGTAFTAVPAGGVLPLEPFAGGASSCRRVLAGCGDLNLPARTLFPLEIYAVGSVTTGEACACRAILAGQDIRLGARSWSLRWLHADGVLVVGEQCALHGRASADVALRLEQGCRFERLNAPTIAFGAPAPLVPAPAVREPLAARDVPRLQENAAGRWLVRGELVIPPGRLVQSDVVVIGSLRIGHGTRVSGSLKSHGNLILGDGVEVEGAVVSSRSLHVGRGARIKGPAIAERDAWVGSGARIGRVACVSTLSVRRLEIEAGAVVHGTVWAHGGGIVVARPQGMPVNDSPTNGGGE